MMLQTLWLVLLLSLTLASPVPEASPEALASPDAYAQSYGYFEPAVVAPVAVPLPPSSQFHTQDDFGQYNYGFTSADQTKTEIRTADGVTRGAYSYVDSNGIVQSVNYISDALGFRVAASNLPVHVIEGPAVHAVAPVAEAVVPVAEVVTPVEEAAITPSVDYAYLPYAQGYNYYVQPSQYAPVAPHHVPVAPAPVVQGYYGAAVAPGAPVVVPGAPLVVVPAGATGSQYLVQDEAGSYSFGYNDPNSVRQEVKVDGVVTGAYQYVDSFGVLQTVHYIADSAGFRVAASNLPQGTAALPVPVVDTPEVAAAKIAHAEAVARAQTAAITHADIKLLDPIAEDPIPHVTPAAETYDIASAVDVRVNHPQQVYYGAATQTPTTYVSGGPGVLTPVSIAVPEGSQFHVQDDLGQYSYGYQDQNSVKQEIKTGDGVTRGTYSYVDANGIVQTVNYISDVLGFRVAATNLPVHHIDAPIAVAPAPSPLDVTVAAADPVPVVAATYEHPAIHATPVIAPQVSYAYLPYATNYGYNLPIDNTIVVTPNIQATPVDVANSQFHAQDDLGQYNYGFSHPTQTKQEVRTADGVTRGAYSYVDANGLIQSVNYISDALGFRVAATNLPVHNIGGPVEAVTAEDPVIVSAYHSGAVLSPQVPYSYLPYAQNYGYFGAANPVGPVTFIAPAIEEIPTPVVPSAPTDPITEVVEPSPSPNTYTQNPIAFPDDAIQAIPTASLVGLRVNPNPQTSERLVYSQAAAAPLVPVVHAAPVPLGSQYHVQDDFGQYSFGYADGNSVKKEVKTADGVVRGAYSYVDSDGIVQSVNYIADALGFRVGATNLPVHNIDAPVAAPVEFAAPVVAAPAPVIADAPAVVVAAAPAVIPVIAPHVNYAYLPYATDYGYSLSENAVDPHPVLTAAGTIPIEATPVDGANSQFHAQDDLGQYNYGFSHPTQTKQEVRTADGVTRGAYSYVDANGLVQTVNYISDAMGFRVAATNLPVHIISDTAVEGVIEPAYLPYAQNFGYTAVAAA